MATTGIRSRMPARHQSWKPLCFCLSNHCTFSRQFEVLTCWTVDTLHLNILLGASRTLRIGGESVKTEIMIHKTPDFPCDYRGENFYCKLYGLHCTGQENHDACMSERRKFYIGQWRPQDRRPFQRQDLHRLYLEGQISKDVYDHAREVSE